MLRREGVHTSILSFAEVLEPRLIQLSFRPGVNGFMHIEEIDGVLVRAVRRVGKGEPYFSPRVPSCISKNKDALSCHCEPERSEWRSNLLTVECLMERADYFASLAMTPQKTPPQR